MKIDEFINEVKNLNVEITEEKLNQLEKYYNLIIEYNKIMNLTGITKKEDVYLKHFYDSLTISKVIDLKKEKNLCDLGSGAGFPGIVIKIFYPNLEVTLVDSLTKRINFLNIVIKELDLKKIYAKNARIEDYAQQNIEKYDVVTARAVAPFNILLELGIKLVKINKYFVGMKGNMTNEPNYINALNKLDCVQLTINQFKLPIENSDRSLILIQKMGKTNKMYPRKYGNIKKNPL